jgi:hypothetical protein
MGVPGSSAGTNDDSNVAAQAVTEQTQMAGNPGTVYRIQPERIPALLCPINTDSWLSLSMSAP